MEIKVPKVNPKARKFEIGVRSIRDITIYPLSLADELSFSEKIIGLVDGFDEATKVLPPIPPVDDDAIEQVNDTELRIVTYVVTAIKENLVELLVYVTDENVTLSDIDNEQFIDLCDIIFEMNFEGAVGKGMRLLKKIKNLLPQKTPSENLSSPQVTDTSISSDSVTETEE